ncbi:MAG: HD domain-containing protein [Nitrospirota bacterium]|nr:MAG: HD domain-containing protein [Nitrospirota bacterium]
MSDKEIKLELITILTTAISNCSLYSTDHSIVKAQAERARDMIMILMGENDETEMMIIDNDLVFDKEPFKERSIHLQNFIKKLQRKGIDKMIFKRGFSSEEVASLIGDVADIASSPTSYDHISLGAVEVRLESESEFSPEELENFREEQINKVKDVFSGVSRYKKLDITGLEDVVINFIAAFKKEVNILNIMTPFKSYTEWTYTHAANVAIITLFQAEALGIKGELIHEIGVSALLHDVGKMFVSNDILNKAGKLTSDEWEEIQKHTLYGAKYLLTTEGAPQMSVPIALQHHLRYDGKGYPRMSSFRSKQHIFSQIVTISDFFDAIRAKRPYKKDFEVVEILSLLKKGIGTTFNPMIANSFINNLGRTLNFN